MYVEGNKEDIAYFKYFARDKEIKDKAISEENFIPYPKKFRDMDEKAKTTYIKKPEIIDYVGQIYCVNVNSGIICVRRNKKISWCGNTKWGLCETKEPFIYPKGNKLFYEFDTAWSPPIPIIIAMSKKFERLKFTLKFYEGANNFKGTRVFKNGIVISQTDNQYRGSRGG